MDSGRGSRAVGLARESLDQYRQSIFTGYSWTPPDGWYGAPIDSVYDDGRFTWVRIKDGSRVPMVVRAIIDDQRVIVQNTYDAEKLIYRIHGVFPKLLLQHGSSELTITRGNAP